MSEIPYGYCQCGCGQKTRIALKSNATRGYKRGEPMPCVRGHTIKPSKEPIEPRFWSKVKINADIQKCWEWQAGLTRFGYGKFSINRITYHAHRISWELVHGEIPNGLWVLHSCDNPRCVNPNHLFLGTNKDNVNDRVKKGRSASGNRNANHKLDSNKAKEIREAYSTGLVSLYDLAKQYNVGKTTVAKIVDGLTWKVGG